MASRPPEQTIHELVEFTGSVRLRLEDFKRTWGVERLGARDRREISAALARVGIRMEPPLNRVSRGGTVLLTIEAPARAAPRARAARPATVPLEAPEPKYADPQPEPIRHGRRGRIWTGPSEAPAPEPSARQRPQPPERNHPEPAGAAAPAGRIARTSQAAWVLLAGVGLMVLGSLGPWAKAVFVTESGLDRNGALVIVAALVVAVVLGFRLHRGHGSRLALVSAALAAFAAAMIASDFRDLVDDPFVGPYWGLYMAFAGSAVLVGLSMAMLVRRQSPSAQTGQARSAEESA